MKIDLDKLRDKALVKAEGIVNIRSWNTRPLYEVNVFMLGDPEAEANRDYAVLLASHYALEMHGAKVRSPARSLDDVLFTVRFEPSFGSDSGTGVLEAVFDPDQARNKTFIFGPVHSISDMNVHKWNPKTKKLEHTRLPASVSQKMNRTWKPVYRK